MIFSCFTLSLSGNPKRAPDWVGFFEVEGKRGNFRNLVKSAMMIPLWGTSSAMLSGDVRYMFDNQSVREGNVGISYRRLISTWDIASDGLILGVYAFLDFRRTSFGNSFKQGTFGIEALGEEFQIFTNLYKPQNKVYHLKSMQLRNGWDLHANGQITTFNSLVDLKNHTEKAMRGYDILGRYKFSFDDEVNLWANLGHYHFSRDGMNETGPIAALEVELLDRLGIYGSRMSLGGEVRKNRGFKADKYITLKFAMPLDDMKTSDPSLKGIEYQMTRFIQRDVDIVSIVQ